MTANEAHEIEGRARASFREAKKELGALKLKAKELSAHAEKIAVGLDGLDRVRWWDGRPMVGQRPEHIILTNAMFADLTAERVHALWEDVRRVTATIDNLRTQIREISGEDPAA